MVPFNAKNQFDSDLKNMFGMAGMKTAAPLLLLLLLVGHEVHTTLLFIPIPVRGARPGGGGGGFFSLVNLILNRYLFGAICYTTKYICYKIIPDHQKLKMLTDVTVTQE